MRSRHCIYGYSLVGREDGESGLEVDGESDLVTIIIDYNNVQNPRLR